jgi:uncharacterized protein (DUF58 family)
MRSLRQAARKRLRAWAARRHGRDTLPMRVSRRRIYILPTRFGMMLAVIVAAMLIAGLNYNSNLGLAFAFLVASLTLVTMHHCNRNLLGILVDVTPEIDAFAGREASAEFVLRNESSVERPDVEIRVLTPAISGASGVGRVSARDDAVILVAIPVPRRGVLHVEQFELRTRYPFGWFYAWTYVQSPLAVFVAPAPLGARTLPSTHERGAAATAETSGDEDFSGLRAYQPGMPLKHMAWKSMARGGEPAVRTYTGLASRPEWLEWDALDGLDAESRLSQLCLWILESEAAQRPYGLRIPGKEIAPSAGAAHRFACLRTLAAFGAAEVDAVGLGAIGVGAVGVDATNGGRAAGE